MPFYQAIVLAIVQGLTEFLPISSTAHLALFPWFMGWKDPGLTFDVALHLGTLLAVLLYFWRLWIDMFGSALGWSEAADPEVRQNRGLFWFVFLGTLPAGLAGWFFEQSAEHQLRQPVVIGGALIGVGLLMWAGDRLKTHTHTLRDVSLMDSLLVGVAQAFAIVPGVSRAGVTMTAGLFRGMTRETCARFSFLLSTPIIAGAALKAGMDLYREGLPPETRLPFLIGVVVAGLVGYLVIAVLIRYLERRTFRIFVVYRIVLGVVVFLVEWGWRHHLG